LFLHPDPIQCSPVSAFRRRFEARKRAAAARQTLIFRQKKAVRGNLPERPAEPPSLPKRKSSKSVFAVKPMVSDRGSLISHQRPPSNLNAVLTLTAARRMDAVASLICDGMEDAPITAEDAAGDGLSHFETCIAAGMAAQ
jgi:hypothetical protein